MKIFSDNITRRGLLITGSLSLIALPALLPSLLNKTESDKADRSINKSHEIFLTGHKVNGEHFISGMTLAGAEVFRTKLQTPFHSIAACPATPNIIIGIPRDPDSLALVISTQTGQIITSLKPGIGRHFNGHGCFSLDGRYFYASENNYIKQQGSVGIYDLSTKLRTGELNSFGQGPHELGLLSDNRTLVIANGGVQTLPESGREALNKATMLPSLAYIDSQTGKLLQQHELSDHHLSIRHMTISTNDTVGVALQYKGRENSPALVGFQRGSAPIQLLKSDSEKIHWKMNNYTASIAIHPKSGVTGVTCPRGNLVTFWDSHKQTFLKALDINDPGGIALSRDGKYFFITSATGDLFHIESATLEIVTPGLSPWPKAHWGNHFTQLAV